MSLLLLTKSTTPIIGPISTVFGYLMNFLFNAFSSVGIENVGVCIIVFTAIVNILMIPLSIKQQKSSKMMAVANPELQAINAKYKGRTDQESMTRMQAETRAVYDKYGVSMTSGCLPLLIQLPILYALYPVMRNIPAYVESIKSVYMTVANAAVTQADWVTKIADLASSNSITADLSGATAASMNSIVDLFTKFDRSEWAAFTELFPDIANTIQPAIDRIINMNYFLGGINLMESPGFKISLALLIPLASGLFQWLSVQLMKNNTPSATGEGSEMAQSMNQMNNFMPLISVVFCFSIPAGLGLYWAINAACRCVIQVFINKYMDSLNVLDLIEKNLTKKNAKRAKEGLPPLQETKSMKANGAKTFKELEAENKEKFKDVSSTPQVSEKTKEQIKRSNEYYNNASSNPGSIASRAHMIDRYNEKNKKDK